MPVNVFVSDLLMVTAGFANDVEDVNPVSYTHLTLPTITGV